MGGLLPSEGHKEESVPGFPPLVMCWPSLTFLGLQKLHPHLCLHLHMAFSLRVSVMCLNFPFYDTFLLD